MDAIEVRQLLRSDIQHLEEFDDVVFAREVIRDRSVVKILAEIGDTPVGYLIADKDSICIELAHICVHPDYRMRGVGRKLIDDLSLSVGGDVGIECMIDAEDYEVMKFFTSCGFSVVRDVNFLGSDWKILRHGWRTDISDDLKYRGVSEDGPMPQPED